jgi:hypothetical protein
MFSGALSEKRLNKMGKIYLGKPLKVKTRQELIATLRPHDLQFLRVDNGDLPDGYTQAVSLAGTPPWSKLPEPVSQLV